MNKVSLLRILFLLLSFVTAAKFTSAQNCIEIESILADACGTPEGENEMVRFKIGASPINISTINVNWPNNTFLGISPVSPTTNAIVNSLNSTIVSCGYLVQPVGGLIPAGKTVLLVTSTNISLTANSFANLSDTLYAIFQNPGNTAGHFVNYSATPGLRTLSITAGAPACTDAVTYDRSFLINQTGGSGGTSAQNDGATIEFSTSGTATYINNGCQAPIQGITADAGSNSSICQGGSVSLSGSATGNYTSFFWQGGQGSFSSTSSLNTVYTATVAESGSIILSLGVVGTCNDTVFDNVTINITPAPIAVISLSGSATICQGSTVSLNATGGDTYFWNTGSTSNTISVSTSGTYTVTASNACGSSTATQTITVNALPVANILVGGSSSFCAGGSVVLYTTGTNNFTWSTGSTNDSITVNTAGTYTLTASNSCGNSQATQNINVTPLPVASISASGSTTICAGSSVTLNAAGGTSYSWSTGATGASIIVSTAGTYSVTASNSCGSSTASQIISVVSAPSVTINSSSNSFCAGSNLLLYATGTGPFLWTGGSTNDSLFVTSGGNYTVTSTSSCGTATDNISITQLALPSAVITPSGPAAICPGSSVTLNGSGGSSFSWFPGGSTASSLTVAAAGTYTLTAANTCGTSSTTILITSLNIPVASLSSSDTELCSGETTTLNASGGTSYLWSTGQSGSSIVVSQENVYWVSAINSCGADTAFISINVDSVDAFFTASTLSGIYPLDVDFINSSSSNAVSFFWNAGNGTTTTLNDLSTTYTEPGNFTVTLTATNGNGCQDTYSLNVIVYSETSFLQIPNVFTPNNDGVNDLFGATSYRIAEFKCTIFDRWGILITEISSVEEKWDGRTTSGIMANDGTYFYVLKAIDLDGKSFENQGFIQLFSN